MLGSDYQFLAMRTNDRKSSDRLGSKLYVETKEGGIDVGGVLNGCLGLSGEAGEFNDMVKKWIFHEKELDVEHAKKEMGDVMWYVAMICESMGWQLDEILRMNVDKLKNRYPAGFDVDLANNRKEGDV